MKETCSGRIKEIDITEYLRTLEKNRIIKFSVPYTKIKTEGNSDQRNKKLSHVTHIFSRYNISIISIIEMFFYK